jgi:hypothetical protein
MVSARSGGSPRGYEAIRILGAGLPGSSHIRAPVIQWAPRSARPINEPQTTTKRGSTVSATLNLKREGTIMENRRRSFEIGLDGTSVGSIERNQSVELPLEPGRHTIQMREGRYSSRAQSFDVADGDTVSFRCYGGRIWPIYLA